jgi:hypothetical protein
MSPAPAKPPDVLDTAMIAQQHRGEHEPSDSGDRAVSIDALASA